MQKLDQEIGRIRQKHEIPLVKRIRSVLLRTDRRIMTKKTLEKKQASTLPMTTEPLSWEGYEVNAKPQAKGGLENESFPFLLARWKPCCLP